jgi:hypothetical protein
MFYKDQNILRISLWNQDGDHCSLGSAMFRSIFAELSYFICCHIVYAQCCHGNVFDGKSWVRFLFFQRILTMERTSDFLCFSEIQDGDCLFTFLRDDCGVFCLQVSVVYFCIL